MAVVHKNDHTFCVLSHLDSISTSFSRLMLLVILKNPFLLSSKYIVNTSFSFNFFVKNIVTLGSCTANEDCQILNLLKTCKLNVQDEKIWHLSF